MFARIVTFAGGDQNSVDEGIAAVRVRFDAKIPELDGTLGFWIAPNGSSPRCRDRALLGRQALRRGE